MLRKLDGVFVFLAMMLAILLEDGIGYGILQKPFTPGTSFSLAGERIGPALPQAWLFGALCMFAYRLTVSIAPFSRCAKAEVGCKREAFMRLWRWTIALTLMQGFAFFLERIASS